MVVILFAYDGLGGGDCGNTLATSCVFECGHVGSSGKSDVSFSIFYLASDSGNLVFGYVGLLDGKDVAGEEESLDNMQWETAYVPSSDDDRVAPSWFTDGQQASVSGSVGVVCGVVHEGGFGIGVFRVVVGLLHGGRHG